MYEAGASLALTDELVLVLTTAMDLDENVKLYHCWRVAVLADHMAQVSMPEKRPLLFFAGLLHEVGGIGAPMHMLHYPLGVPEVQPLPREVLYHGYYGAQFVRMIPGLRDRHLVGDILLQHHEHYDGSGFPNGLREDEILPEASLLHAADMFDCYGFAASHTVSVHAIVQQMRAVGVVAPAVVDLLGEVWAAGGRLQVAFQDETILQQMVADLYAEHRVRMLRPIHEDTVVEEMFTLVGMVIDRKHGYTQGHSARVASYAVRIAQQMGLPGSDLQLLRLGASVHDIGKLGVPRSILDNPEHLSAEQWVKMKNHARLSWEMLNAFPSLQTLAFAALHHERWDGKGYPLGLAGKEIPLLARILSAADALDAMTSVRAYRPVWTFQRAVAELLDNAGTQFDPVVARAVQDSLLTDDGVQPLPADAAPVLPAGVQEPTSGPPARMRHWRARIRMRPLRPR